MNYVNEAREKMAKSIDSFLTQTQGIRQDAINSGFIGSLKIDAYGNPMCIEHLGFLSDHKGRISINPYDPALTSKIAHDLKIVGFDAYVFSKTEVAINVPPPSGEDRETILSHLRKLGEDARIAIRNARKKCKQQLSREELDETALAQSEQQLQQHTDAAIKEIDAIVAEKTAKLKDGSCQSSSRRKNK